MSAPPKMAAVWAARVAGRRSWKGGLPQGTPVTRLREAAIKKAQPSTLVRSTWASSARFSSRVLPKPTPGSKHSRSGAMPSFRAAWSLSRKNPRTRAQMSPPVVPGSMTTHPHWEDAATWSISSPKPVTSLRIEAPASNAFWATQG